MPRGVRRSRTAGVSLLTATLVTSVVTLVQATPAAAAVAGSIVVDPSVAYQTIQGWGTSLAWWAEGAGGWTATHRQALDSALFGLNPGGAGLGLNVVRFNIGASTPGDTCAANMRVGAAQPSFDTISDTGSTGGGAGTAPGSDPTSTNYDWSKDPNQVNVLTDAQTDGANVFDAVSYSAPASMTKNNCSGGSSDGSENLASTNNQAYADYLAAIVKHFHDNVGITFNTVDPVNEPVNSGWNNANCVSSPAYPKTKCQQGMAVSTSSQNTIVSDLASDLSGISYTHISAPDEQKVGGTVSDYNSYTSSTQADVSQINTHAYGDWYSNTENGTPAYLLGQYTNKPVWMSEWGAGGDVTNNVENHPATAAATAAMTLSQEIVKNENEMHPSAWVIWQAADGPFNGQTAAQNLANGGGDVNDLWGIAGIDYSASSNQTVTYPLRYWVMGNYSQFVRPGYRMIRNTDPNTFTAWDQGSNKLVIVTTNPTTASATNSYDLSHFGLSGATVTAYQTAAAPSGGSEKHLQSVTPATFSTSTSTLSDTVPAQSVTTYVVSNASYSGVGSSTEVDDATTGTGTNQWNYTGSTWGSCTGSGCGDPQNLYAGTTHWDWTANDRASMTFTGGRVRLFGVTDTGEGRATVSIDGGAATELDFYAASRHGDQLMWESPQLGSGSHTLTVTISGAKDPKSAGTLVALDRAEIDPLISTTVDDAVTGTGTNQWNYGGSGWVHCPSTSSCADPQDMYAATASWDGSAGDTATLTFTGTSVTLFGMTDNNEGIANVSIDGGTAKPIDFYSPTRVMNAPVFAASGLSNSSHTLTVTATNQKDADSGGIVPVIDRAVVNSLVPASAASISSVDDTVTGAGNNQWHYVGGWQSCSGSACGDPQNLFARTTTWDATANDTATLTVSATSALGTTLKLYGVTDTNEGKADISVDGGTATTVDFYSASRQGDHLMWTSANLGAGSHTVTVKVDGTRNSSSTGNLIALDRATIAVTAFIASVSTGTARNNFTGAVGMQFTTSSAGLVVTALGREKVTGNTGSHPVAIFNASDGTLVAGASVNTSTAAVDSQGFQYAALPAPVTLPANTTYYLLSYEWSGSDQWSDLDSTVTLTGGGTINPAYVNWDANGTPTWTSYTTSPGHTYGPVSLLAG